MNITRRKALAGIASLSAIGGGTGALASEEAATPVERVRAALSLLQAAMQELHPGWEIHVKEHKVNREQRAPNGGRELVPQRHFAVVYAYDHHGQPFTEEPGVYVNYRETQAEPDGEECA